MDDEVSFADNRLVLFAGKIHVKTYNPEHTYRVDLFNDPGLAFSEEISGAEPDYFAVDANPEPSITALTSTL